MGLNTKEQILNTAANMIRSKGFAAFSYADLASVVGIRKASIHHYFSKKENLGLAVIEIYLRQMHDDLEHIDRVEKNSFEKLLAFADIFNHNDELLPLCGALAAEMAALPLSMQEKTQQYFTIQLTWLEKIVKQGVECGLFSTQNSAQQIALQLLSLFEGTSLIRWVYKNGNNQTDPQVIKKIVGLISDDKR